MMVSPASISPAESLLGRMLGDWRVVERYERDPRSTGGNFCVGYRVLHADGRHGFCKALDYSAALSSGLDPAVVLQVMTESYNFERDLLRKCEESGMSRVIRMMDDGVVSIEGSFIPVNYIIFEYAEYDIRRELDRQSDLEAELRLRTLHHVATGLKQLHAIKVAHQDLKPSNVLIVDPSSKGRSSKLGDLGRATDSQVSAPHDDLAIAGDPTYAPPEQLYNATPIEFGPRRLACDLYHLGSLATFMFTTLPMNGLLAHNLHPSHMWTVWAGTYADVLPYVRDAYGRSLVVVRTACPDPIADRLTNLVSYLCEPDPYLRGHPAEKRNQSGNPYGLERIVSELDLLATRAAMRVQGIKV
jgi:serine/threonine protein kinase